LPLEGGWQWSEPSKPPGMAQHGRVAMAAGILALCERLADAMPIKPVTELSDADTCPGSIEMGGFGKVEIVATKWNIADEPAGPVAVEGNKVIPHYHGRSYFATKCQPGQYDNKDYAAVPLLNKAMTFTTDLSEAGCGCNVALYLTSLHQNDQLSTCKDYYCDANIVCGVACAEIDIMEANRFAFLSTLHAADDRFGVGGGYGGGADDWSGPRDFKGEGSGPEEEQYGPTGKCVNTMKPFQVTSAFPMDYNENLMAMVITLWQTGMPCNLTYRVENYDGNSTIAAKGSNEGMQRLGEALYAGMTPIASLWGAADMTWMDGKGNDTLGACDTDSEMNCPNTVAMYNFYLEDLPPPKMPGWHNFSWIIGALIVLVAAVGFIYFLIPGSQDGTGKGEKLTEEETSDSAE